MYTAYANNTTFFVKNQTSVTEILKVFDNFSKISGLKPNKSKCEIAGLSALKQVRVEKNFNNHIAKVKNILKT